MTLSGHDGVKAQFMGTYDLSSEMANGAPLYTKPGGGADVRHYLYRCSTDGRWVVTNIESDIVKNRCLIQSSRAADLPSNGGLTWQYYHGSNWCDDPKMKCQEVRWTGSSAHRAVHTLAWPHCLTAVRPFGRCSTTTT